MRRILMLGLALTSAAAFAQAYRWVDPATGRTMITDTPPPGIAKQVSKTSQAKEADGPQSYAIRRAAENFPVVLYTAPNCVADCKLARDLLNGRGVPFTEKMVQNPPEIAELKELVGEAYVPTLKVGRQPVKGFQAESYDNLLDLAGYPKAAPPGGKPAGGLTPAGSQ